MTSKPQRKPNRLKGFDYSTPTAYFVTICTQGRRCILSTIVGASIARPPTNTLTDVGKIVDVAIQAIPNHYPSVRVDKYVIMPNHLHMILHICTAADGRAMLAPTNASESQNPNAPPTNISISKIVQHLKGIITKQLDSSIWQKSFHDHVIRSEHDYRMIWEYIDGNPFNWTDDCFYQA